MWHTHTHPIPAPLSVLQTFIRDISQSGNPCLAVPVVDALDAPGRVADEPAGVVVLAVGGHAAEVAQELWSEEEKGGGAGVPNRFCDLWPPHLVTPTGLLEQT